MSQPSQSNGNQQSGQQMAAGICADVALNNIIPQIQENPTGIRSSPNQNHEQPGSDSLQLGMRQVPGLENGQMLDPIVNANAQPRGASQNGAGSQLRALEGISQSLHQLQRIVEGNNRRHASIECPSIISQILQEQQRMMLAELSPSSRSFMRSIVDPSPLQELLSDVPSDFNQITSLLHEQRQLQNSLRNSVSQNAAAALFSPEINFTQNLNLDNHHPPENNNLNSNPTTSFLAEILNSAIEERNSSLLAPRSASQALPQNIEPHNPFPQASLNGLGPFSQGIDQRSSLFLNLMNQGLRELQDIFPLHSDENFEDPESDFFDSSDYPLERTQEDI